MTAPCKRHRTAATRNIAACSNGNFVLKSRLTLADVGDVMNARDVQCILGIGRNATYQLLESGILQSIRVSERRILITKQALEAFLGMSSKSNDAGTQKGTQV